MTGLATTLWALAWLGLHRRVRAVLHVYRRDGWRWELRLADVSAALAEDERVLESNVVLLVNVDNRSFVDSNGSKVQAGHVRLRIMMSAMAQAEDGMRLSRMENFEVHTPEQLPAQTLLLATAKRLREELVALRAAPLAEPYAGPAVLAGRAAGVFFHEIFGHRLEGHRQKDDLEGQTFATMVGKRVLPVFLDMVDDPTAQRLGGVPLSGHYFVDDEAVPARRTLLVERGKLRGFLLGRSPVLPFKHSNGHGRRERGNQVVARQGNLIVTSRKTIPDQRMRQALIDEAKRQNKPYGLWFSDIQGGYTITERSVQGGTDVLWPAQVQHHRPGMGRRAGELQHQEALFEQLRNDPSVLFAFRHLREAPKARLVPSPGGRRVTRPVATSITARSQSSPSWWAGLTEKTSCDPSGDQAG